MVILNNNSKSQQYVVNSSNFTSTQSVNSILNSGSSSSHRSLNNVVGGVNYRTTTANSVLSAANSANRLLLDSNSLLYTTALENLCTPRLEPLQSPTTADAVVVGQRQIAAHVLSTSLPVNSRTTTTTTHHNNNENTDLSPSSFLTRATQLIQRLEKSSLFTTQRNQESVSSDDSLEEKTEFIHFEPDYNSDEYDDQNDDSSGTTSSSNNTSKQQDEEVDQIYHQHRIITTRLPQVVFSSNNNTSSQQQQQQVVDSRKFVDLSLFFYSPPHNLQTTSTDSSILTASTTSTSSSSQLQSSSINTTSSSSSDQAASMMMSNGVDHIKSHNSPNSVYYTNNNGELNGGYGMMDRSSSNGSNNSSGDEHERLLAEMELIERLPTQERLKQAKRRRALQLKKWSEYEKELMTQHQQGGKKNTKRGGARFEQPRSIKFQDHVVLLDAVMRKDYNEVERLLQTSISPNVANEDGLTAIHQCCIDDDDELLLLLIRYGANVNVVDNDQWTPLHAAATCGNVHISKILIENGADLLAVNTDGNMPYDICDEEVCLEYIESEMAARGITQQTIDMKRGEQETRMLNDLRQVCFKQLGQVITFNRAGRSTVNGGSNKTSQVVHSFLAYFNQAISADERLDLNAKDLNGATLLHIACANGYNSIVEFLLNDCRVAAENGSPIIPSSLMSKDNDGWTPLHVAVFWGHQRTMELLLEHGADIHAKTNSEDTVLDLCDDPDVREFIVQKSKEIETEQQKAAARAAAAAAAAQLKLQMITNNTSQNNSSSLTTQQQQNLIKNGGDKTNSSNNINNSSTRSLKRTSTGVSRSSSVRRSSFRDKEKAKKLDISFKDVLYANEIQEKEATTGYEPNQQSQTTSSSMGVDQSSSILSASLAPSQPVANSLINSKVSDNQLFLVSALATTTEESSSSNVHDEIKPVVINHNKDYATTTSNGNQQKLTTVVKIINNNTSTGSPQSKNYESVVNGNILPNQVARIHSHGGGGGGSIQQNQPSAMAFNLNPIMSSSTNYSMTSSMVSDNSALLLPNNNNNNTTNGYTTTSSFQNTTNSTVNNLLANHPHSHHETGSNNTLLSGGGGGSVAIIDVSSKQVESSGGYRAAAVANVYGHTQTVQPTTATTTTTTTTTTTSQPRGLPMMDNNHQDTSLKYKFKSNETIGLRNNNVEFDDINVKTSGGGGVGGGAAKMNKCAHCFKCCHLM